ncbi:hypothetical protein PQI23_13330 [Leucobacter sp. USCH14]|uniref:hypothetical protein n=1 Tax=Leucobacter sp. USCH14 TaxID=3024838 RepID=UPI00309DF592
MGYTAFEQGRKLHIDLGDGEIFTVPPIPGRIGREMLGIVTATAFGTDMTNAEADSLRLGRCALGLPVEEVKRANTVLPAYPGLEGHEEREQRLEDLRGTEQILVTQAAILWNVQHGSIDAVHDLLNTPAGEAYPKALDRVMRSCGLGPQFRLLRNWLSGELGNPTSTDSMPDTNIPNGTSSTEHTATNTSTNLT